MAMPPLPRHNNKLRLPYVDRRQLHNDAEGTLPKGAQISDIVMGTQNCGVNVNRYGQLEIISEERSRRNHKTALILSRASPSLTEYDIRGVFESQNDNLEDTTNEGLEEGGVSIHSYEKAIRSKLTLKLLTIN